MPEDMPLSQLTTIIHRLTVAVERLAGTIEQQNNTMQTMIGHHDDEPRQEPEPEPEPKPEKPKQQEHLHPALPKPMLRVVKSDEPPAP